ncbi:MULTISPECIES: HD domain-containing phosphohydrolase [unclassified Roseateles]|uniref:HD domain-containing phosphohydrolase n=1 Tax=unclassified Roseateles TaxID=2626991 RepID=UPI000AB4F33D|nr:MULTISPECIES: HD domain-containing phosphohydrolase [unclassified Roseateles]
MNFPGPHPQPSPFGAEHTSAAGGILVVQGTEPHADRSLIDGLRRARFVVRDCGAADALAQVDRGDWDAVVLDAQADFDAAVVLAAAIRARYPATVLPIVMLATRCMGSEQQRAFDAGASDCIGCPADVAEVGRRLSTLAELRRLRRKSAMEQSRFGAELSSRSLRLNGLIETCIAMSMCRDRAALLQQLLSEGRHLLNCDGGTMYMVTEEQTLRFELRTRSDPLPATQIPLYDPGTGNPNENYVSVYTALHNQAVRIDDVYAETRFDLSGTRAFDDASGYRTVSMLTVPIAPRGGSPIGVLQFMNALDPFTGAIVPFDPEAGALVEALAAQAAVALDNMELVDSQKQLTESLIRVLATTIDAKSPHTGRHCERVPELAMRLAQAACDASDGPLKHFAFRSEREWEEFRIGAWLHDCGKVTTPEYVIDKATKLETIHNRIHEVRMRFEVLHRDLEIARLQAQVAGTWSDAQQAAHAAELARLKQDFEFVARCNVGDEALEDDAIEALAGIGARQWTRHFDDRLGLSAVELAARAAERAPALPCTEPLLADRPRDIVARPEGERLDPAFGFRMDVPEHLYNRGELYNLSVRNGTLTREERYKINEHMVHTVMMLERMPFPKHLKRVPEYAGTHHERMDGKGYPRQLGPEQLSVPSRIMAVADIFEALTAADRPYKKPKPLSEALTIMQRMAGTHIDADIYNLFLRSGVYLAYAHKHLDTEQIDVSDPTPFCATAPHA